jgi:hypothetical protein
LAARQRNCQFLLNPTGQPKPSLYQPPNSGFGVAGLLSSARYFGECAFAKPSLNGNGCRMQEIMWRVSCSKTVVSAQAIERL